MVAKAAVNFPVNNTRTTRRNPLRDAIVNKDVNYIRNALNNGLDPNAENNANTYITWAVAFSFEIVRIFVEYGASVNNGHSSVENSFTPIYMAILHGRVDIFQFLVLNGADVNTRRTLPPGNGLRDNTPKEYALWLYEQLNRSPNLNGKNRIRMQNIAMIISYLERIWVLN